MRFKNFTLLFLMGIFGLFSTNLFAQQDASIDPADIRFWIGEGENQVVFIVNWNEPDTALAWGYRFAEDTVILKEMMEKIAIADSRFSFTANGSWLNDIAFHDGILNLQITQGGFWMYNVNGEMSMNYFDAQSLTNGDYVKWGDSNCGTLLDPVNYIYVWEKPVAAVYPLAEEATIDPSEILYWIGEGANEVVFAVNWNEPNKCLAWGYRFDGESAVVKDIMDAIADNDKRFAYEVGGYGVSDITFNDDDLHLALVGMYWLYNVNGSMAGLGFESQTVSNGDFIKWGDISCATEIASWTYVWEKEVEPVSVYTWMNEFAVSTLSVYPNPAVNEAFVTVEDAGVSVIAIYDMQGRLVNTMSVNAMAGEQVRISAATLNAGVYFVSMSSDSCVKTAKLVVR